jgi:hypothetical protein
MGGLRGVTKVPAGRLCAVLLAALLLVGATPTVAADCMSWSDARGVIAKNGLRSPAQVRKQAIGKGDEVLSMNLCRQGGGYVYKLTVVGDGKRARDVVVDAGGGAGGGGGRSGDGGGGIGKGKVSTYVKNRVKFYLRRYGLGNATRGW